MVERLQGGLDQKEEQYAEDLQKWVVDINAAQKLKLSSAVREAVESCEAKHSSAADSAEARQRELEERVKVLEDQLRKANGGDGEVVQVV